VRTGAPYRSSKTSFRCHSQNGEDGILLHIFPLLGTTNRRVIEICAGDGIECNSANLIINHGWRGLLVEGDAEQVARGTAFYGSCRTTWAAPPLWVNRWVTAENVSGLVADNGFGGPVDLLSLDIDGNDYWIWQAVGCVNPRVVGVRAEALAHNSTTNAIRMTGPAVRTCATLAKILGGHVASFPCWSAVNAFMRAL